MKEFNYTVKDALGIHARPAGLIVKEVKKYNSTVTLEKDGKMVDATRLMAVMGLGVKQGQDVKVVISGEDEDVACKDLQAFFEATL